MPQPADPIAAYLDAPDPRALAVITAIDGPSYRPLGAMMAVLSDTEWVGNLSSGCIEADIAGHAAGLRKPKTLRYGRGSGVLDLQLPCGGGLEVLLLPRPDRALLHRLNAERAARRPAGLRVSVDSGALMLLGSPPLADTHREGDRLEIAFAPELRFVTFGSGPEADTFAGLVAAAGYPNVLLTPNPQGGTSAQRLSGWGFPSGLHIDPWTAILLFFHDHDREPPLLAGALQTPAFYIGAQGSQRARDTRHAALAEMGVSPTQIARLHGPVGLIPSVRDPRTLAVSVLAEVLSVAPGRATARAT